MSLLGLLLLIGVVVDDAIVVLENIYRRHEDSPGIDRYTAAIEGTQQVGFAVIAASLTLVSIFGSVLFLEGIVARFFQSFAVVVTVGVLVSLFVSLTLTPMLCSRFLDVRPKRGAVYDRLGRLLDGLDRGYRRLLGWVLEHRGKVLLATLAIVLSSGFFFARVDKDFIPEEDDARFMVSFRAPLGTSRATMEDLVEELDAVIRAHPEVKSAFIGIGFGGTSQVNSGMAFVTMVPRSERRHLAAASSSRRSRLSSRGSRACWRSRRRPRRSAACAATCCSSRSSARTSMRWRRCRTRCTGN